MSVFLPRRSSTSERPATVPEVPLDEHAADGMFGRHMKVEVVRSNRRRKTVQAQELNGVVRISIPATMTRAEEQHWVDEMVRRFERRAASRLFDVAARAESLARRYGLPQ